MEIRLPRNEIQRLVRAHLGIQTNSALSTQLNEQHVAIINAAALKAQQECAWVNAQRRVTVDLQAEQDTLNYPDNAGPGSVRGMVVFEDDRYYILTPRIIPLKADQDQQQAAGGEDFKAAQGRPLYFEQRDQIKLWPYSDKPYKVRIDYLAPVQMAADASVSIIDAMMIVYASCAMIAQQRGEPESARFFAGQYDDRKRALMGWQSQGTTFALNTEADLAEDEFIREDQIPQWDRRPTIRGV